MTLANKMTVFRIILIPVMIALFYTLELWGGVAAAITFAIASFTDVLDGYVARKYKQVSDFGKIFDPLADKMLVTAAMILLLDAGVLEPIWGAIGIIIILLREFVISVIRQLAAMKGNIVAADVLGKIKTLCLNIALIVLLISIPFTETYVEELWYAGHIIFAVAVVFSVISLINYFVKNRTFLRNATKIKEVRQLNAGLNSSAHPEPGTVYAVQEKYPQMNVNQNQSAESGAKWQPVPQQQPQTQQPHANINLVHNITEGKLTKDIFDSIVLYVIATQVVSLIKIQEKFQIGYRIASDAIDKMEEYQYITKLTPTTPRRVLITRDEYINMINRQDFK